MTEILLTGTLSLNLIDQTIQGLLVPTHIRHYAVSLSKTLHPLLNTGSNQEDRKFVDLDIKHQPKNLKYILK